REPAELSDGFIPDSDNIPRGVLEFKIQNHDELKEKTQPVLVYCQSGMRGALAADTLNRMGYQTVYNLAGGFEQWTKQALPVAKDPDAW
ncbi:MAG: rhodanese-like domain-containing protein, partial [Ketobacteraceae bacterium]|nr:rhodanese-like domain-containing protein [Ketobacteraceae bacterium]